MSIPISFIMLMVLAIVLFLFPISDLIKLYLMERYAMIWNLPVKKFYIIIQATSGNKIKLKVVFKSNDNKTKYLHSMIKF